MDKGQLFKKYYSRLIWEGIIKALICGFIVGLAVTIIPALIICLINVNGLWLSLRNFNGLWLLLGVGFGVAAVCTHLFYFLKFHPTTKQIAARIDRLGLEERLITMLELEQDKSYIAMRQREDTKGKLSTVKRQWLKISVSTVSIIAVAALFVCSASMIAISSATFDDRIPWHQGYNPNAPKEGDWIAVNYEAEEGGSIYGETEQFILFGKNATTVVAVADEGYAFMRWSDDLEGADSNAIRTDKDIRQEISASAIFAKLIDLEGKGADDGEVGDEPPEDPSDGQSSSGADGEYDDELNWILDGETYYRQVYQQYYEEAMRLLSEGKEIPPVLRMIIETYFKAVL